MSADGIVLFISFWIFLYSGVFLLFCMDKHLDTGIRFMLSFLLVFVVFVLTHLVADTWASNTEPPPDYIAEITELTLQTVVMPDGKLMKVLIDKSGSMHSVYDIIKHEIDESTKFYQLSVKGRFSGIAYIVPKHPIVTTLPKRTNNGRN